MKILALLSLAQKNISTGIKSLTSLLGRLLQMGKKGVYSKSAKPRSKYQRKYNSTPEQNKRRSNRNKARRAKKCPEGKDVHHKDGNPNNNKKSNLTCQSPNKNRANNKRKTSATKSKVKSKAKK